MIYRKNNSNINIAYWFYNKGNSSAIKLSEQKIQSLLFLSQMHYSIKYKKLLMPSLFVYSKSEIYDPTIKTIMNYGFPLMPLPDFDAQTNDFLELIWQKYSSQSDEKLYEYIYSLKYFKELRGQEDNLIINPLSFADSHTGSVRNEDNTKKSKIMISQNGPVKVSAWTPRKLNK